MPLLPGAWISSGRLKTIARELTRISRHPYVRQAPVAETEEEGLLLCRHFPDVSRSSSRSCVLLGRKTDTDFTAYKPTTLKRRIGRRMALAQIDSLAGYLTYLSDHQAEVEALYQDVLIGVTSFFRDPSTFETLEQEILPNLLAAKAADYPHPGVGARLFHRGGSLLPGDLLAGVSRRTLSSRLPSSCLAPISMRRRSSTPETGIYPPGMLGTLSPARLEHFFLPVSGSYRIRKAVRDLCVFAQHNLLKDPPFSRLDLLSCQNVLIYLGSVAQKKIWPDLPLCARAPRCTPARASGNHRNCFRSLRACRGA